MNELPALPIDAALPAICAKLGPGASVLIKAQPGAGKTTRVPAALLRVVEERILVLEPRRLAARLSAERVASELGETCGETVGYQIRFQSKQSAATRLIFVTEGIFLRLLQDQPKLSGISAVVIDEFHERHLHTDLALAAVRALQQGPRPDLRLVVMSATLDSAALEAYLPQAAVFDVPGRTFPVTVDYLPADMAIPVEDQVASACRRMLADPKASGDILVFLPGLQDIRRCMDRLQGIAPGVALLALAADLPAAEQARVFQKSRERKIILSTNVAETSLTIPGVTGVIDCGTAKIAGHASWSGMPTLDVKKVSQASSIQRSGRAGRVAPGIAYRLFSEADFLARPAFSQPDIRRLDLSEVFLSVQDLAPRLKGKQAPFAEALPWFEAPEAQAVGHARQLLTQLGALRDGDALTPLGQKLARLPFHPRLGAMLCKGQDLGCGELALAAATLISEGMILRRGAQAVAHADCDIRFQLGVCAQIASTGRLSSQALAEVCDFGRARQMLATYEQAAKRLRLGAWPRDGADAGPELTACLLAGFPDRVAKRRSLPNHALDRGKGKGSGKEALLYNFCLGRGGVLAESSVVRGADLILALDTAEAQNRTADRGTAIYVAAALSEDDLLKSGSMMLGESLEAVWSEDAQRADLMKRRTYGQLVIHETRVPADAQAAVRLEEMLRIKLAEVWPKPFADDSDLISYHARVAWILRMDPEANFPHFAGEMLELLQADICSGKRSFREIAGRDLASYLNDQLPYELQELLRRDAPLDLRLANSRRLKITYETDKPPFLTGFVQDFYGLAVSPKIRSDGESLTLHLLGPNRRPLQVTSDLAGFWQRHYPNTRAEFGRKYPRHYWPEQPATAEPFLYYNQWKAGSRPDSKA